MFFVGPAVGYLVKCEMHGSFGGSALTRPCDDPSWQGTLDVNDVDWGYNVGGTVELRTRGTVVVAPRIALTVFAIDHGDGPPAIDGRRVEGTIAADDPSAYRRAGQPSRG